MVGKPNRLDALLGRRLRDKRIAAGWTQGQLAERLGVEPEEIAAFERGEKRIGGERFFDLSEAFGVRPGDFLAPDVQAAARRREGAAFPSAEQGLRLNRAFSGVRDPTLREAIVAFVAELAHGDGDG